MIFIKKNWTSVQNYLFLFIFGCILAILSKILLFPGTSQLLDEEFSFPPSVPLSKWEFVSTNVAPSDKNHHLYKYRQGDDSLTIDVEHRFRDNGSINRQLMVYYKNQGARLQLSEKYEPNKGYIAFFKKKDNLYLTACLNPVGESTITQQQFVSNRYKYGWSIGRVLLWLIGQQDLFDGRCLWTNIFSPLPKNATESDLNQTAAKLEQAWQDWSNYWKGRW